MIFWNEETYMHVLRYMHKIYILKNMYYDIMQKNYIYHFALCPLKILG